MITKINESSACYKFALCPRKKKQKGILIMDLRSVLKKTLSMGFRSVEEGYEKQHGYHFLQKVLKKSGL